MPFVVRREPTPAGEPTPTRKPTLARAPPVYPNLTELFRELDPRLPHGFYRIPSLVSTPRGTLLAIINGRMHRRDVTPNIIYLRRSVDDGATWSEAVPMLSDPNNATEYGGAPIVDPRLLRERIAM